MLLAQWANLPHTNYLVSWYRARIKSNNFFSEYIKINLCCYTSRERAVKIK